MIREGLQMKMNKTTRFILSKLFAIAMIAIGMHVLNAYMVKVLPFGIVSNDMALWGVWSYTGWFFGLLLVADGILKLLNELLEAYIRKLDE